MMVNSIGDNISNGIYYLHSQFHNIVNLINNNNEMVSIASHLQYEGPNNIILEGVNFSEIKKINISDDLLWLNGCEVNLTKEKLYRSTIKPAAIMTRGSNLGLNLLFCIKYIIKNGNPKSLVFIFDQKLEKNFNQGFETLFINKVKQGIDLLLNQDILSGVSVLKGLGLGLTPAGDDFNAGLLYALNYHESVTGADCSLIKGKIYDKASSENVLANHFLKLAYQGRYSKYLKDWMIELSNNYQSNLAEKCSGVLNQGETSGADLMSGFLFCLKNIHLFLTQG
ncbi:MAG: DUF2877 domain-containing protein [Spirochaetes bacterium]|nr:DUF2877 domain-containing protein [Spirochaetota bacterium]